MLSLNQKAKDELRARLQLRDPEGFAAQELRRKHFLEMTRTGKIQKNSVALLDSGNELFYDDPYDAEDPMVSWSLDHDAELSVPQVAVFATPTRQPNGIITNYIFSELQQTAIAVQEGNASMLISQVGGVDALLVELCASKNS